MKNQKTQSSPEFRQAEKRVNALKKELVTDGIGKRIKEMREAIPLTGKELGSLVGLSQPSISDIETGRRHIDCYDLPLFAAALNTTVDKLCTGHDTKTINLSIATGLSDDAIIALEQHRGLLNYLFSPAEMESNLLWKEGATEQLLAAISDYIFFGNDFYVDMDFGTDENGKTIKQKVCVKDIGIFRIREFLDSLNKLYCDERTKKVREKYETGKR